MTLDELAVLCREAAGDLVQRESRPLPTTVILPASHATAVTSLPDFPDDDIDRFELLSRFAADRMRPAGVPCYGFMAEATLDTEQGPTDVLMVVYGARRNRPQVTAAPLSDNELGQFTTPEPLDPTALPFLSPLQHAADAAEPPDVTGGLARG